MILPNISWYILENGLKFEWELYRQFEVQLKVLNVFTTETVIILMLIQQNKENKYKFNFKTLISVFF